jgi:ATP-dependent Clp protease ATP-binding subunit ClpC
MSIWDPFTELARRSIVMGQVEAERLGHSYVGTEHILLGVLGAACGIHTRPGSEGANALRSAGVKLARAREQVVAIVERGNVRSYEDLLSPRAWAVIKAGAFAEARLRGHAYIGPAHLVLALIAEVEGGALQVLTNLGTDVAQVMRNIDAAIAAPIAPSDDRIPNPPETPAKDL